jgi:hypothetical protein
MSRAEAVRQELQAEVHQLPAAQPEAGELHPGGGGAHCHTPRHARKQVIICSVFSFLSSFQIFQYNTICFRLFGTMNLLDNWILAQL